MKSFLIISLFLISSQTFAESPWAGDILNGKIIKLIKAEYEGEVVEIASIPQEEENPSVNKPRYVRIIVESKQGDSIIMDFVSTYQTRGSKTTVTFDLITNVDYISHIRKTVGLKN